MALGRRVTGSTDTGSHAVQLYRRGGRSTPATRQLRAFLCPIKTPSSQNTIGCWDDVSSDRAAGSAADGGRSRYDFVEPPVDGDAGDCASKR